MTVHEHDLSPTTWLATQTACLGSQASLDAEDNPLPFTPPLR